MSRLAKKSINLAAGVSLAREGDLWVVSGPKGKKEIKALPGVNFKTEGGNVSVTFESKNKKEGAVLGTYWALLKSAAEGVTNGFLKNLDIEGVGYRVVIEGKELVLHLGYAVPVRLAIPEGIKVEIEKSAIKISGLDKELVGQFASNIRSLKKPEPYKGKGIRYRGEVIKRKVGKKAGATATA